MKDYFKRLPDHPGFGLAIMMTFLGALAGASNKNFNPLDGALFGAIAMGLFCWIPVLWTNRKSD